MKTKSFQCLVLKPSFLGQGAEGRLVPAGTKVVLTLDIAQKDVLAEDGETVRFKKGEPIGGDNIQIIGEAVDDLAVVLPAGLPTGAIPAGNGQYLVPSGDGATFVVWEPGNPTPADAIANLRANAAAGALTGDLDQATRFNPASLDLDGSGDAGGSLDAAEISALLTVNQVDHDPNAGRDLLFSQLVEHRRGKAQAAADAAQAARDAKPKPRAKKEIQKDLDAESFAYDPKRPADKLEEHLALERAKKANAGPTPGADAAT